MLVCVPTLYLLLDLSLFRDWSMLLSPGSQATVNVEPGSFLDGGHVTQL